MYAQTSSGESLARQVSVVEALDPALNPAAIVPFTYSSNLERLAGGRLVPVLSVLSKMSIEAACSLQDVHYDSEIVVAGEHSYGEKGCSTSALMADYALGRNPERSEPTIFSGGRGNNLNNTPRQVQAIATGLRPYIRAGRPIVATAFDFHIPRLLQHSDAYELPLLVVTVEDVLECVAKLDQFPPLQALAPLARRERLIERLTRHDPRGRLLNILSTLQGPRLHDLEQTPNGNWKVIMTRARKQHRQLSCQTTDSVR